MRSIAKFFFRPSVHFSMESSLSVHNTISLSHHEQICFIIRLAMFHEILLASYHYYYYHYYYLLILLLLLKSVLLS